MAKMLCLCFVFVLGHKNKCNFDSLRRLESVFLEPQRKGFLLASSIVLFASTQLWSGSLVSCHQWRFNISPDNKTCICQILPVGIGKTRKVLQYLYLQSLLYVAVQLKVFSQQIYGLQFVIFIAFNLSHLVSCNYFKIRFAVKPVNSLNSTAFIYCMSVLVFSISKFSCWPAVGSLDSILILAQVSESVYASLLLYFHLS